jgi:ribonuclease G
MKGDTVLLDTLDGRRAAAWMRDGRLEDLLIDNRADDGHPPVGSLFRGRVDRPMKGQGGVFLSLPGGATAFLRDTRGLAQGQSLLVQVTGFAEAGKAIPVTNRILFKSKYAIVTPGVPGVNISRSIRDEDLRMRLRAIAETSDLDVGTGLILRSAAAEGADEAVAEDVAEMAALSAAIMAEIDGAPELLLEGPDAHHMAWREWGDPADIDTTAGCFAARGVLDEIDALRSDKVSLTAGGSMWVEPTRALVAIDVNTGPDTSLAAALKVNLAAARELPRQLRLRGLGGQITMDLAPVVKKDRKTIEQTLRNAFRADAIETALVGWTPLGHFELQRKRERRPLSEVLV